MLIRVYWFTDGYFEHLCKTVTTFDSLGQKYSQHERMQEFRKNKSIAMIYLSNKLERTLPISATEHDMYRMLSELTACSEVVDANWNADGGTADGRMSRAQLYNHFNAYNYLCEVKDNTTGKYRYESELTVNVVLMAHEHLMKNAVCEENSELISNGKFRQHNVCTNDYVYFSHEHIASAVETIVETFNRDKAAGNKEPFVIAANLFYDLITVHPFADGNGRLCQLFATFALFATGTPFPVSLTSGRSRSRKHYLQCILKARTLRSNRRYLYTLFASSLESGWASFLGHIPLEGNIKSSTFVRSNCNA